MKRYKFEWIEEDLVFEDEPEPEEKVRPSLPMTLKKPEE